ncbi:hypothetical protein [Spirosoma linguale]|uniref:HlyD family secretion protein n=1 Tax=Spirosoma linguale (strain ATCC 33905 / DSM 74 / LMG 10896 / Claus 1) TaxID=504472 RepID=D2QI55_SPILD|nr:hypothetical protein Slin_0889 [Spirosoma linguale DSM 74]
MPVEQISGLTNRHDSYSDEMQEIIGHVPHWLIRWGNVVIFAVIALLLLTAHTVRYPDVIMAQALINARDQPQKVTWFISDPNVTYRPNIRDGQQVRLGDTLISEVDRSRKLVTPVRALVSGRTYLLKGVDNNPKAFMLLVVPPVTQYEVQLKLPLKGAGKVNAGQRVLIRLDAYPSNEFGFLEGQIVNMVPVSLDNHYRANVKLTRGLITNMGNILPVQPLLQGTAEIMLDNKRLTQRIFATLF